MWTLLSDTPGWQILELPLFPENGACADLMTLAANDGYPTLMLLVQKSPTLRFQVNGGGPAQPIGGPNRHFRHELRRYARVLAAETGAEPKFARMSEVNPDFLEQFFDLEEAGWKGRKGSAIKCRPDTLAFYRQIAKEGARQGYFCMHSLEVNGTVAAGSFSVVSPGGFFPMKIAHDESLRKGGPGHLLFNAIVAECIEKSIPELFFGGTEEHYKTLWTQETIPHYSCIVFSPDIRSRLAYRIRRNVLSPLGKLRWALRERFGRDRPAGRRGDKNDTKAKRGAPTEPPAPNIAPSSPRSNVQSL
jgi:CelD/BcsL family acetyltransferase involved in cellulose biosynthesis